MLVLVLVWVRARHTAATARQIPSAPYTQSMPSPRAGHLHAVLLLQQAGLGRQAALCPACQQLGMRMRMRANALLARAPTTRRNAAVLGGACAQRWLQLPP